MPGIWGSPVSHQGHTYSQTEGGEPMSTSASPFGELIYSYTREQAISDGVLVPVPEDLVKEAGIKLPVAVSDHLYSIVDPVNLDEMNAGQTATGRLWDLLWMFRTTISDPKNQHTDRVMFKVLFLMKRPGCPARLEQFEVLGVCGPGDMGEPVLTLMFPEDD